MAIHETGLRLRAGEATCAISGDGTHRKIEGRNGGARMLGLNESARRCRRCKLGIRKSS